MNNNEIEFNAQIQGKVLGEALMAFFQEWLTQKWVYNLIVLSPDIALWTNGRSHWGGSGGIAYFDQVWCYFHGQTEFQEWQWRDQYDCRRDNHANRIFGLDNAAMKTLADGKVEISVRLLNPEYSNRQAKFILNQPLPEEDQEEGNLTKEEQTEFALKVQAEIKRLLDEKMANWEHRPQMPDMRYLLPGEVRGYQPPTPGQSSYKRYAQPFLKDQIFLTSKGVAAWVLVEQIDHFASDAQVRYELYVYKRGDKEAKRIYEDHAYERREASTAAISLMGIRPDEVLVFTRQGKRAFEI